MFDSLKTKFVQSILRHALSTIAGALMAIGINEVATHDFVTASGPVLSQGLDLLWHYLSNLSVLTGLASYISAHLLSFWNARQTENKSGSAY